MGKTCFFIGHRVSSDTFKAPLAKSIEQFITEYGVTDFVMGGYGGFERLGRRALFGCKGSIQKLCFLCSCRTIPTSIQWNRQRGLTRRSILQVWKLSPTGSHRPGQSVYGVPQRFSDCLCLALGKQRQRSAGVRQTMGAAGAVAYPKPWRS